jgi:dTDP-4-dehydrorhamnose 3,5-epimerase
MNMQRLRIPDVVLITPIRHGDDRGFFSEVFRDDFLVPLGLDLAFVQDNHVFSANRGVLRGLHFQSPPHAQGKLVRCTRGSILDVAVDVRVGSPTFGQHVTAELSADSWTQIWVPPGFAHGYVTLEPDCEIIYKVTTYYAPTAETGIAWDDPALAIDWRLDPVDLTLSDKDRRNPALADIVSPFEYAPAPNAPLNPSMAEPAQ